MITVKLCAFSDEADASLEGQIDALKRNNADILYHGTTYGLRVKTTDQYRFADYTNCKSSRLRQPLLFHAKVPRIFQIITDGLSKKIQ